MILTGGRSAEMVCRALSVNSVLEDFPTTKFYIGDERCLPLNHKESNSRMVIDTLFGGDASDKFEPIYGDSNNTKEEAVRYSEQLPDNVDLLLLSVGEDGHIASLFPYSELFDSNEKIEIVNNAPKPPTNRITITPKVIQAAKEVIVMAAGKEKGEVLAEALINPKETQELPVRLTVGRTWLLDEQASIAFQESVHVSRKCTNIVMLS